MESTEYNVITCNTCGQLIDANSMHICSVFYNKERGDSTKFDGGKIMFDLLPFAEIEDIAMVLTYGAKKYEKDGWKKVPDGIDRYFAALMRHLTAYKLGEEIDSESGLSHLSHACTNLMFIMYLEKHK